MVTMDHGQPRYLILKKSLNPLCYRREVVTRRSIFELRKAREHTHILEKRFSGCSFNIDEMIAIIRNSKNREEAAATISSRSWTLHSDNINLLDVFCSSLMI